jgi:hypothetical protein
MKTTQGWGWLTAGVLALGLNGFYHDGGAAWAHRLADQIGERSVVLASVLSEDVDGLVRRASLVRARGETGSCRVATTLARVQTKFARGRAGFDRLEALSAREEAGMARMEAQRARMEAQAARASIASEVYRPMVGVSSIAVACPRVHVSVPRVPIVHVSIPQMTMIEVDGPGPI